MSTDRVLLPTALKPSHYNLELSPDLNNLTFLCNEEISVSVLEVTSEVTLHSKEIIILEASFKGVTGNVVAVEEISYNLKNTTVKLTFAEAVQLGEGVLSIKYSGILNADMSGFYRSYYTDADGQKKVMASTQFEALDARRAFPCWDEPSIKATFSVSLVVAAHLTAISNMPETLCNHIAGGKKRVSFQVTPRMSTYLIAWAVGEFDMVQAVTKNNVSIRIFSPPGRAHQGRFALDCGVRALDFYDEFFQVPYPLPKLDMICITEFAMGAMENWGLVTYRETALMIDEDKASPQQKQRVAIVVAHELAHQWFGNLVTMAWWDGLWLNEGFAAWMEHFTVDALYPEYHIWDQFTTDGFGSAQRLDSLRTSHPIIVPIKRAEEVEEVFDAISYCKGSTVVNMIFSVLGHDLFRAGLQLYMKKHAYQNTETADLWQAWSEVSGIDVADLMKTWTTRMGYPFIQVENEVWTDSSVEFTLSQHWFLADGSVSADEDAEAVWSIPLVFSTSSSVSSSATIMRTKQQTFSLPLVHAADWLKINSGCKALVRVAHSREMTQRLLPAIRSKSLSSVDRAALLLDAYALAKAGLAPVEDAVQVLRGMEEEDDAVVWGAIAGVLLGLNLMMEQAAGPDAADVAAAFQAFGRRIVMRGLSKTGWEAAADVTEGHSERLLRTTVIGLLDTFAANEPEVLAEALRRFHAHWETPSALPSDFKSTVYRIVLKQGGEAEYETVLKTYYAAKDSAEQRFAYTLGCTRSTALKLRTLDWALKSGDIKTQDFFYPIGPVASDPASADLVWNYFKENFDLIKEKLRKASPSLMDAVIVNCINRFVTTDKADEVSAFFASHPVPSSARRISQSVEQIRSSAALLQHVQASQLVNAAFWQQE